MSVKAINIPYILRIDTQYLPLFRYALGSGILMLLVATIGNGISYIVPMLALSFLGPGTKMPTVKDGLSFVFIVIVSTIAGFLFTKYFYEYSLFYILILGLSLFWIFYTDKLPFVAKLFLLISLLAFPVPDYGVDTTTWAYALTGTLVFGAIATILVVWIVFSIFPDPVNSNSVPGAKKASAVQSSEVRLKNAVITFLSTFPVILTFIFFRWGDLLLVLIYIVVLTMLPIPGHKTGAVKFFGNLIGGTVTLVFYWLIITVPNLFFFILLYIGTALFFATKVFSGKPSAQYFKTGFSALTLIIGGTILSTDQAGSEISDRIFQVMIAVVYVVLVSVSIDAFEKYRLL
jgi:hypothetical protein